MIIGGFEAQAGKNISIEHVWLQLGSNFSQLFLEYADQVKFFNQPIRPGVVENFFSTGAGECDWYSHYGHISEETVLDELDTLSSLVDAGYKYYIMDDGWGSDETLKYYNWSSWDPVKFPNGMAPCIAKAHGAGLKFVVWNRIGYAPLWVQQTHPGWLASQGGDPEKDSVYNMSLPAVQAYIADVFTTWKNQGIDGLKVDFIISGLYWSWAAQIWNEDKTRTELVNQYLDILDREAARCNLSILLCGTPYGYPSLARYANLVASRVTGDTASQGGLNTWQIATTLLRSFWWARAFNTPDPDAFNSNNIRGILAAAATGGALYHGNDFQSVHSGNARLAWAIHWAAPALPDNLAYCGNLVIARGRSLEHRSFIAMNLDESSSRAYSIEMLPMSSSAIRISAMCSMDVVDGRFEGILGPASAEMLILYTGQPPLPVSSCLADEIGRFLLMAGPIVIIAVIALVLVSKNKTKRNS